MNTIVRNPMVLSSQVALRFVNFDHHNALASPITKWHHTPLQHVHMSMLSSHSV